MNKRLLSIFLGATLCLGCVGCGNSDAKPQEQPLADPPQSDGWCCIFAAATLNPSLDQLPKTPHLTGSTCRQQFQAAASGTKIRLTFSNEYSETLDPPAEDMVLESVHIAKLLKPGEPNIDTSTDTVITFNGSESVTIPAGETVTSDEIDFTFEGLEFLAVSTKFGTTPAFPTCHAEADCGSWVVDGNHVSENFNPTAWMWSYFSFCRADAYSEGTETLVCFGDSITDGSISTFNGFDSWSDLLGQALQSNPATKHISVVNTAIAGNAIWGGSGIPAKDRFERDVLNVPGVRSVVILIGTNDIPGAQTDTSEDMIKEYKAMIEACHSRGIKIYAGIITPFGNNDWWASELHEQIRSKVNEWMLSEDSGFDGVVDFAAATCDPDDNTKLKAEYDSGDGLHPSVKGHKAMGDAAIEYLSGLLKK